MPSPLAHTATGLAIYLATLPDTPASATQLVLAANAPDLDAIPGIIAGEIGRFHNYASHSICFAVAGALLLTLTGRKSSQTFLLILLSALTHLVLDGLGSRRGLQLLWPLSDGRYRGGLRLFYGLRWNAPWHSGEHLKTIRNELPYALGIMLLGWLIGDTRARKSSGA